MQNTDVGEHNIAKISFYAFYLNYIQGWYKPATNINKRFFFNFENLGTRTSSEYSLVGASVQCRNIQTPVFSEFYYS